MYTWNQHGGCGNHKTWGVYFANGELVAVCVYKKGAIALCNLLNNYKKVIENA